MPCCQLWVILFLSASKDNCAPDFYLKALGGAADLLRTKLILLLAKIKLNLCIEVF